MELMKKRDIFFIRLLVIIIIAYLTIFGPIKDKRAIWSYIFIAFYLSTNLLIPYIPDRFFISRKIFYALVFFDSGMVSLGIYLSGNAGTDFYLVYFLILGLASMSISLKYLMINATVFTFLYGWILYQKNLLEGDLFVSNALRLPFMIIIAFFFGYIVDTITKDKDKSLRESEDKYRQLFTTESDAIVVFDEETVLVKDINDAALNLYGYDREEFLQLKATDISAGPGKAAHVKKEIIDGNTQNIQLQYHKKKDGTLFPAEVSSGAFVFQNRRMISTIIRDISERIQAEEELEKHRQHLEDQVKKRTSQLLSAVAKLKLEIVDRGLMENVLKESEEKYRTVLEASPDPVVVYDMEGKVVYFNPAFTSVFGWTLEERLDQKMDDFVPEESWLKTKVMIDMVLAGESFSGIETRRYTKEGSIINVSLSGAIYKDQDGNPIGSIIIQRDISEQKKLEAQLQRAQKMEALGILAGGVAHDLNNVLSGIVSYPDLLLMQIPEDSPLIKPILTMQDSGKKAADIVQDLLTLARRGVIVEEVMNLNEIISEHLKNPEHDKLKSFHPMVEVETSLASDLFNISGSPVHLSKTVMNLVSNAAEAMPDGGKILVSTENRYFDRSISGYDSIEEGDYVTLTVSDTGVGISPEDNERIFEPFYTKKVMGRSGTGLGMAVVWGTVKDHKGYIDVQSTEGKGTTFTLYFPATRRARDKEKTILPIENYMGKGESILVVDDAKQQREIVFNLLTTLGYIVDTVSSGEKAVDYMKNKTADLLILDMIMDPGIDGLDTYKKIIEIHPGQKAIIASGFSETYRVREAQKLGAGQYIKKPYTLGKIGIAVRDELDK
jgi:PAS domain S-box-containing protein